MRCSNGARSRRDVRSMPVTGVEAVAVAKGLAAATRGAEEITKVAAKVADTLRGSFKILNQEITILCPEELEKVSIAFQADSGMVGRKIKFQFGKPRYVQLRALHSMEDIASRAVTVSDDGFEISTRGM